MASIPITRDVQPLSARRRVGTFVGVEHLVALGLLLIATGVTILIVLPVRGRGAAV